MDLVDKISGYPEHNNSIPGHKPGDTHDQYIEQLKRHIEALKTSEQKYHRMVTEVRDYAILLLDKEGIVQNWNTGAAILKGYEASEIIGKSFKKFYQPEDLEKHIPDNLLKEAEMNGRAASEGWRVRKDGSRFWGSVVITALHNDAQELIGYSKVTRDLTERKAAEDALEAVARELQQKNKVLENLNRELSSYAYVVSHDLKEPIRKIRVFSARQREAGMSIEQILQFSQKIEDSAVRMQMLMEDLIKYSELSTENVFEEINLNEIFEVVQNELEVLINEKQATIVSDHLPTIKGIKHQLYQLFQNIMSNSLKFSKQNEKLIFSVSSREVPYPQINNLVEQGKKYYEISFQDNGIGFSSESSKKIFEVFHRLQQRHEYSGSGIGLAIVKKVMENHAGFIVATSQEGKGATFNTYFPK